MSSSLQTTAHDARTAGLQHYAMAEQGLSVRAVQAASNTNDCQGTQTAWEYPPPCSLSWSISQPPGLDSLSLSPSTSSGGHSSSERPAPGQSRPPLQTLHHRDFFVEIAVTQHHNTPGSVTGS